MRAIRAGRCRERRYADHIFIQIYFRMHHFVVKFSKFSSPADVPGYFGHPYRMGSLWDSYLGPVDQASNEDTDWTGLDLPEMVMLANDRRQYRQFVHGVK